MELEAHVRPIRDSVWTALEARGGYKTFQLLGLRSLGMLGFGRAHRTHRNRLAASQLRFGESLKNYDYPWPAIDLLSGDMEKPIETQALPAGEPLRPHPQGGH